MPQMITLRNSSAKPVPGLEDRNLTSMLQQYVCASQTSETSAYNANADLPRFGRCNTKHLARVGCWWLYRVRAAKVQIALNARHAVAIEVTGVSFAFHNFVSVGQALISQFQIDRHHREVAINSP